MDRVITREVILMHGEINAIDELALHARALTVQNTSPGHGVTSAAARIPQVVGSSQHLKSVIAIRHQTV